MSAANRTCKILGLETSTEYCSVSLLIGDDAHCIGKDAGQKHSALLLPMLDEVLRRAGVTLRELDAIAFGAGPGSFTGLRIACGVAQGLAFATGRPVVPVGSLEALAEAAGRERVVVCIDARMGQVYHAAFQREGHCWRQVCAPSLCDPDELPQLPPGDWFACGNGFERYPRILTGKYGSTIGNNKPGMVPRAKHVAILASRYFAAGRVVPGEEAVPMYVRNKVALTMNEQG